MDELIQVAQRLQGLRDALDLSLDEMAAQCGIAPSQLQEYESGNSDIPVSFLQHLASRFGVELTVLLFGEEPKMKSYYVTRNGKGVKVERRAAYAYQDLACGFRNRKLAPFMVTISPQHDAGTPHSPNSHEGHEFNYVVEGSLEITVGGMKTVLNEGDSIMFDSSLPHSLHVSGEKPARMIAIIC